MRNAKQYLESYISYLDITDCCGTYLHFSLAFSFEIDSAKNCLFLYPYLKIILIKKHEET